LSVTAVEADALSSRKRNTGTMLTPVITRRSSIACRSGTFLKLTSICVESLD